MRLRKPGAAAAIRRRRGPGAGRRATAALAGGQFDVQSVVARISTTSFLDGAIEADMTVPCVKTSCLSDGTLA